MSLNILSWDAAHSQTMDAGTVTLVIYLAGMGPAPRDPFLDLWISV